MESIYLSHATVLKLIWLAFIGGARENLFALSLKVLTTDAADTLHEVESGGECESEDDKLDSLNPTPKSTINQSGVADIIELYSSVRDDSMRLNTQLMQLEDLLENVFNVKIKPESTKGELTLIENSLSQV